MPTEQRGKVIEFCAKGEQMARVPKRALRLLGRYSMIRPQPNNSPC